MGSSPDSKFPQPDMPELEDQNELPADAEQPQAAIPIEVPIPVVPVELPVPADPIEIPAAAVPVEQPRPAVPANQPGAEDVISDEQEELSSMSGSSEIPVGGRATDDSPADDSPADDSPADDSPSDDGPAEVSGSSTSSEDYLPLAHFVSGPGNGPKLSIMYIPGEQPEPPVARRYGGRGLPASRPLIGPPIRRRPPSFYNSTSSASSSSPELRGPRPKRGRSDRQY